MPSFDPGSLLLYLVALVFSIVFHEVSHGWVADAHGDHTARLAGRLTLNPIPHIDPWGSILLPAILAFSGSRIMFGWAKPVPVDVNNLRNPRIDGIKVALAGPGSNLLLGTLSAIAFYISATYLGQEHALSRLFEVGVFINALLAVFNLLPVPPLDGSWLLDHTLRGEAYNAYRAFKPYGMFLIIGILLFRPLSNILIGIPVGFVTGMMDLVGRTVASVLPT
jgi:Zn-dependent protease